MVKTDENLNLIIKNLPTVSGVYKMKDADNNIIYIGKAKNLKSRVSSYFDKSKKHIKTQKLMEKVVYVDYIITASEREALMLESNLVHEYKPYYNILLKDDKAFPYIKIYKNIDFPKIEITRRVLKDNAYYFGPFFGNINYAQIMKIILMVFKIRTCNLNIKEYSNKKPCLKFHIEECSAPCNASISKEAYQKEISRVIDFLKGDLSYAKIALHEKMLAFSDMEQYEKAGEIKGYIDILKDIGNQNVTQLKKSEDIDVFGFVKNENMIKISLLIIRNGKMVGSKSYDIDFYLEEDFLDKFILQYYIDNPKMPGKIIARVSSPQEISEILMEKNEKRTQFFSGERGTNKRLLDMANTNALESLQKHVLKSADDYTKTIGALFELKVQLGLTCHPNRIECYDISNLASSNIVASMVVFEKGKPKRAHYRKFKITLNSQDDFASMNEVLTRRLKNLSGSDPSFSAKPDLIVVDGGKGQLSAAMRVLSNYTADIELISLAKRQEEVFMPHRENSVVLPIRSSGLKLLQAIRDESHRFAVTYQRTLREKTLFDSALLKIKGVSRQKAKALTIALGGINKISTSSTSELMQVSGIGKMLAQNIYDFFQP